MRPVVPGKHLRLQRQTACLQSAAYSVTLESTDKTEELARERSKEENRDVSENEIRNEVIYNLIELLESNGDEIQYDLPLEINGKGNLTFTESGSTLRRFKQDIYGISNVDDMTGEEKDKAEKWLNSSPEEVYEYLRMGTDGPTGSGRMFEISDDYSMEDTLKIMSVRYDLYMNRYSQTTPITVASNISNESIAALSERHDEFRELRSRRILSENITMPNIWRESSDIPA